MGIIDVENILKIDRICGTHHDIFQKNDVKNEENYYELRTIELPAVGFESSVGVK